MKKSFDDGLSCIQDMVNYKKDGTPFLNRLLMLPLPIKGDGLIYVGFQNDITELKGLQHDNESLRAVNDSEIRHMVNNPLALILVTMAVAVKKATSEAEVTEAVISLSDVFKRINEYALNIENVSNFENFNPFDADAV